MPTRIRSVGRKLKLRRLWLPAIAFVAVVLTLLSQRFAIDTVWYWASVILAFLGAALIFSLLGAALWLLPKYQLRLVPREEFELENEARKTVAQILGGLALLLGLYFTWQTVTISQQTLRTTQEDQVTTRFSKAIEQLAATGAEIRLGGIHTLERIAMDWEAHRKPALAILSAYIRDRATLKGTRAPDQVRPDIPAALLVLGRITEKVQTRSPEPTLSLDLHGVNLAGEHLERMYLERAILSDIDLSGAFLKDARLSNAVLTGAHLERADLQRAQLRDAILDGAHLNSADLTDANLKGARLYGVDLTDAVLNRADLTDARLEGADLTNATGLTRDQLSAAYLTTARLPEPFRALKGRTDR